MEWVETTGRTLEEAKESALDELGVAVDDAEFEIVEVPKLGLFGRVRGEARVRARVRPTRPRPKAERRDRRRGRADARPASAASPPDLATAEPAEGAPAGARPPARRRSSRNRSRSRTDPVAADGSSSPDDAQRSTDATDPADPAQGSDMTSSDMTSSETATFGTASSRNRATTGAFGDDDVTVEQQAALVRDFLQGLVEAFDLDAEVMDERIDDETVEVQVHGDDLGLLIGPKGQTLQAVQDLARTVVQRRATGTHHGRVRIDIGAYRHRRREALERFSSDVAASVLASGVPKALEPMSSADRKVVHDTVNDIVGVTTASEGMEPRRWVVVLPAAGAGKGPDADELGVEAVPAADGG